MHVARPGQSSLVLIVLSLLDLFGSNILFSKIKKQSFVMSECELEHISAGLFLGPNTPPGDSKPLQLFVEPFDFRLDLSKGKAMEVANGSICTGFLASVPHVFPGCPNT